MEDLYDVDNVIVPIGGGGLIAGIAVAIKSINPTIRIIGVQSENVHGMAASYYAGEITNHRNNATTADGCDVSRPGNITYQIVQNWSTILCWSAKTKFATVWSHLFSAIK